MIGTDILLHIIMHNNILCTLNALGSKNSHFKFNLAIVSLTFKF